MTLRRAIEINDVPAPPVPPAPDVAGDGVGAIEGQDLASDIELGDVEEDEEEKRGDLGSVRGVTDGADEPEEKKEEAPQEGDGFAEQGLPEAAGLAPRTDDASDGPDLPDTYSIVKGIDPIRISEETVERVAMRLSTHAAAGLDQCSPLHLKVCWETESAPYLNAVMAELASFWTAGKVPSWAGPIMARSRLIAGYKDSDLVDVRPIAIGLADTRFLTKTLWLRFYRH